MVPKLGDYLFRMRVKGVSVAEVPFIVVGNGPKGDVAASDAV